MDMLKDLPSSNARWFSRMDPRVAKCDRPLTYLPRGDTAPPSNQIIAVERPDPFIRSVLAREENKPPSSAKVPSKRKDPASESAMKSLKESKSEVPHAEKKPKSQK
ncbi:hypothetical protein SeMB42_g05156 [Synchytrium endobioticum]|uniref:DET1- and DDB1-associated protein 1 domain-containing protein n=1 Tax=Synchytrium endobioticum TaxID=286115 RepID=A0A507CT87_9FUNG|nr:hypothetical protein SeMB42_g05156 [Synchytrium endobioticum]